MVETCGNISRYACGVFMLVRSGVRRGEDILYTSIILLIIYINLVLYCCYHNAYWRLGMVYLYMHTTP